MVPSSPGLDRTSSLCRWAVALFLLTATSRALAAEGAASEAGHDSSHSEKHHKHPDSAKKKSKVRESKKGSGKKQDGGKKTGLTFDSHGLQYHSPDDSLKLKLGGLFQFDGGGGEGQGKALDKTSDWNAIARRARFQFGARAYEDWTFDAQIDAANRNRPVADFNVGYAGLSHAVFTFGNFKEPFSFERTMSSSDITFLERSVANTLVPRRSFGAGLSLDGDKWTAVAGVFGGNINEGIIGSRGGAVSARVTYAPLLEDKHVLHFGASGSFRSQDPRQDVSYSTNPETRVYDVTIVDTGTLRDVLSLTRGGLEFAYLNEAFRMQAEYMVLHADQQGGRSATYQGGYILAAYVLTGQVEKYSLVPDKQRRDVGYATFSGIDLDDKDRVSKGGIGAWEVAARYSTLDLGSGHDGGGRVQDVTFGLNWYPDKNLRLMFNYVHSFADRISEEHPRANADIFQGRLQIYY